MVQLINLVYCVDTQQVMYDTGDGYLALNLSGPAGPVGPVGQQGPVGVRGAVGPVGPAGPRGEQGAQSVVAGPSGSLGPRGFPGPAGSVGYPGSEGQPGPQGSQGPPGNDGKDGDGVTEHSQLTGLAADDHAQYLTTSRGDDRYYTQSQTNTLLATTLPSLTGANGILVSSGVVSIDTNNSLGVGTMMLCKYSGTTVAAGATTTGSTLLSSKVNSSANIATTGTTLSGTWRNAQGAICSSTEFGWFIRIA